MTPAGLLRRHAAWSLDAALIAPLAAWLCRQRIEAAAGRVADAAVGLADAVAALLSRMVVGGQPWPAALAHALGHGGLRDAVARLSLEAGGVLWWPALAFAAISLPYAAVFEGSRWQATPGKRALGLRVVRCGGRPPGPARAALRQAAGALSWLSLNLGHLLAALPPGHRALHDRIAGARVVQAGRDRALPRWAGAWLGLQALALVAGAVWLAQALDAVLRDALGRLPV